MATSDTALPWLNTPERAVLKNLLPNMYPTMNAKTGKFAETVTIHEESLYASGLVYVHSSRHNPDDFDFTGEWDHIWYTYHNIEVSKIIIGIPSPYFDDCARGHALYVTGLARNFTSSAFESLFRRCGNVRYSVMAIDQNSGETFRWIVMNSFEEAQNAIKERNGWKLGSQTINVCRAFAPGKAIPLFGRTIYEIYQQQHDELVEDDIYYCKAVVESEMKQPGVCCKWFNNLLAGSDLPMGFRAGDHVAISPFVGFVHDGDASPEARENKLFKQVKYSPNIEKRIDALRQANQAQLAANGNTPTRVRSNGFHQEVDYLGSQNNSPSSESGASTIVPSNARDVATPTPIIATPVIAQPSGASTIATPVLAITPAIASPSTAATAAPVTAVPVVATSSWANIAAPSSNNSSNLVFNLHSENKPTTSALRVQATVSQKVVAHQQGESIEEQMRVVLIFNLPNHITLTDVSEAIREGPVLMIKFGTDTEDGKKYVGIVFQFAHDANSFYRHLLQEKRYSTPGRFRFIVDAGQGPPYPYDELLEDMGHPMMATRRLTIVKKGFFFQFGKKHLRKLCADLVGGDKIQLVWLYNGGNGSVVFADVRSAVAVKTKLDSMAASKAKGGPNMVCFEGLTTTFSRDPCVADMHLVTDIPDHNEE